MADDRLGTTSAPIARFTQVPRTSLTECESESVAAAVLRDTGGLSRIGINALSAAVHAAFSDPHTGAPLYSPELLPRWWNVHQVDYSAAALAPAHCATALSSKAYRFSEAETRLLARAAARYGQRFYAHWQRRFLPAHAVSALKNLWFRRRDEPTPLPALPPLPMSNSSAAAHNAAYVRCEHPLFAPANQIASVAATRFSAPLPGTTAASVCSLSLPDVPQLDQYTAPVSCDGPALLATTCRVAASPSSNPALTSFVPLVLGAAAGLDALTTAVPAPVLFSDPAGDAWCRVPMSVMSALTLCFPLSFAVTSGFERVVSGLTLLNAQTAARMTVNDLLTSVWTRPIRLPSDHLAAFPRKPVDSSKIGDATRPALKGSGQSRAASASSRNTNTALTWLNNPHCAFTRAIGRALTFCSTGAVIAVTALPSADTLPTTHVPPPVRASTTAYSAGGDTMAGLLITPTGADTTDVPAPTQLNMLEDALGVTAASRAISSLALVRVDIDGLARRSPSTAMLGDVSLLQLPVTFVFNGGDLPVPSVSAQDVTALETQTYTGTTPRDKLQQAMTVVDTEIDPP